MRIRHYLYRADNQDEHWIDDFIAGYTGLHPANWGTPAYSHAEIGFEQPDGTFKCFSASSRGEFQAAGVRFIPEAELLKNRSRWDVYEEEVSDEIFDHMVLRAIKEEGKPYDWLGILGFIPFGWFIHSPKKWYCSEVCWYVRNGKRKRISPRQYGKWAIRTCRKIDTKEVE